MTDHTPGPRETMGMTGDEAKALDDHISGPCGCQIVFEDDNAPRLAHIKGEGLTVTAPERVYREVAPNVFEDITYEEVVEQARIRAAIAKAKGEEVK